MKNIVTVLKVEDLLKELHRLDVEFVIIGGMAAVAQGSAYLTLDLDLCYSRKKENAVISPLIKKEPETDKAALHIPLPPSLTSERIAQTITSAASRLMG